MSFFPRAKIQFVGGHFYQHDYTRKHIASCGENEVDRGSTIIGLDSYNYINSYAAVEQKGVNQTAARVPDEVEEGEELADAESIRPTNRIYQFHNCQTLYMNAFNNVPRTSRPLEVSGKKEDIDDMEDILFNICGVTVKDSHGSDDQLPPSSAAALGQSPRPAAPSELPKTPPESRHNNPFYILAPPNNNIANNWNVSSSQENFHPRRYPPEYPIPTDSSRDFPDTNSKCLEHLLESALATALVIQTSGISSSAEILTTRAQNTLKALNALVSVESPVSTAGTAASDSSTRSKVTKWLRIPQLQTPK